MELAGRKRPEGGKGHPSLEIVGSHGTELSGKRIVLCVSGSVAAYKAIELARLLMRHGADVTCVASSAATRLIRPEYFRWATGNAVITRLSGGLEHVRLADYGQSDLVVVYPATANTLGKLANGIDDTPVSTVLTVALGSKIPILACLAMHASMYDNAAVKKNVGFLRGKAEFLEPSVTEGKAKAPEPEEVLEYVLGRFGLSQALRGKRVLMTAGPTIEHIDPVRIITNQSTGRTGVLLAAGLLSAGAKVTMVYGPGVERPPEGARVIRVETCRQMLDAVRLQMKKRFDIVIMAAAASDYTPEKPSRKKIKSGEEALTVRFRKAPKIIEHVRKSQKEALLVGFKAEADVAKGSLVREARKRLLEVGADMIIANDVGKRYQQNRNNNEVFAIDSARVASSGRKNKEAVAKFIIKQIEKRLQ